MEREGFKWSSKVGKDFSHLKVTQTQNQLRKFWVGQVFHSKFNTKSRGITILIHKKVLFPADIISDPQGCYIIVTGSVTSCQLYWLPSTPPNWDNAEFITRLCSLFPRVNAHYLILGGDLNCVIDSKLDHSSPKNASPSKMSKAISTYMNQTGYVDPRRFFYPRTK